MRERPFSLIVFAATMFLISVSIPTQILFLQEFALNTVLTLLQHLTVFNILTMLACTTVGVLAYQANKKVFIVAPIAFLIVATNNYWVGWVGTDFSLMHTTLATLGFIIPHTLLLHSDARLAILNPTLRWWKSSQRRKAILPVMVHPMVGDRISAATSDVSESGVLVQTPGKTNLKIGEKVQMRMSFDGYLDVRCTAELVRFDERKNQSYAAFKFVEMDNGNKKFLKDFTSISLQGAS